MRTNIIIFGSGSNGRIAYREFLISQEFNFICFADDAQEKQKNGVDGQKVLSIESAILECKTKHIMPIVAIEDYHLIKKKIEDAGLKPIIYRYKSSLEITCFKELILNKIIKLLEKNETFVKYLLFPIALSLWVLKFKIAKNFRFTGFGHIAIEPAVALATTEWSGYKIIIIADDTMCPNNFLLFLWSRYFKVIQNRLLFHFLYPLQKFKFLSVDFGLQLNSSSYSDRYLFKKTTYSHVNSEALTKEAYLEKFPLFYSKLINTLQRNNYAPFLAIPDNIGSVCSRLLKKYGGTIDTSRLVSLHVRDDRSYNSYRSNDPKNYEKAINHLQNHGFETIRIASKGYYINQNAHPQSLIKSEMMDIYIISKSNFFISSASGPSVIAFIFGVAQLQTNLVHWMIPTILPKDMYIFKHFYKKGKPVDVKTYVDDELYLLNTDENIQNNSRFADVEVLENSEDEILEMLIDHIEKRDTDISKYNKLIHCFPANQCIEISESKLAPSFLNKYESELIPYN